MGTTPTFLLPYPEPTDPADVPTDMRELAERTEVVFGGLGAGDLTRIADSNLAANAASIDFQSIPASYGHLLLVIQARSTASATADGLRLRFNNDSTNLYNFLRIRGNGAATTVGGTNPAPGIDAAVIPGATAVGGATVLGGGLILIPNYAVTTMAKNTYSYGGTLTGSGAPADMYVDIVSGQWFSNAAINRITLLSVLAGQIAAKSRATLYGIRGT